MGDHNLIALPSLVEMPSAILPLSMEQFAINIRSVHSLGTSLNPASKSINLLRVNMSLLPPSDYPRLRFKPLCLTSVRTVNSVRMYVYMGEPASAFQWPLPS